MKKLNLNEKIKVKLTPVGVNLYYNQFDELEKRILNAGGKPLEKRMPTIDKDGFTEMQLWHFMEVYGPEIGLTKPNVIRDLNLYIEDEDLEDVSDEK